VYRGNDSSPALSIRGWYKMSFFQRLADDLAESMSWAFAEAQPAFYPLYIEVRVFYHGCNNLFAGVDSNRFPFRILQGLLTALPKRYFIWTLNMAWAAPTLKEMESQTL
jgi:hypothetical protein